MTTLRFHRLALSVALAGLAIGSLTRPGDGAIAQPDIPIADWVDGAVNAPAAESARSQPPPRSSRSSTPLTRA
jgi:hypothetical protein